MLAKTGERDSVLARLKILESTRPTPAGANNARAQALLGLGDTAQALDALERARDAGETWGFAQSGKMFAGIRESSRFRALLTRVGFSPK